MHRTVCIVSHFPYVSKKLGGGGVDISVLALY